MKESSIEFDQWLSDFRPKMTAQNFRMIAQSERCLIKSSLSFLIDELCYSQSCQSSLKRFLSSFWQHRYQYKISSFFLVTASLLLFVDHKNLLSLCRTSKNNIQKQVLFYTIEGFVKPSESTKFYDEFKSECGHNFYKIQSVKLLTFYLEYINFKAQQFSEQNYIRYLQGECCAHYLNVLKDNNKNSEQENQMILIILSKKIRRWEDQMKFDKQLYIHNIEFYKRQTDNAIFQSKQDGKEQKEVSKEHDQEYLTHKLFQQKKKKNQLLEKKSRSMQENDDIEKKIQEILKKNDAQRQKQRQNLRKILQLDQQKAIMKDELAKMIALHQSIKKNHKSKTK